MWLFNSSVGRKLVMSVSGVGLVLFLVFHLAMNAVAVFSASAYNAICAMLGANWYAVLLSLGLAALFVVHILYALYISHVNWRACGGRQRYEFSARPKGVSWASQNMLVLGAIVVLFLLVHLSHFWRHMMFAELVGSHGAFDPANGAAYIDYYFKGHFFTTLLYLLWYGALWQHLTHGIWSAMQTLGLNNGHWLCRWQRISMVGASVICGAFALITIIFFVRGAGW